MTESKIFVKDKDIVVPGDVLATGMDFLPSFGTYRNSDNILSDRVGVIKIEGKVIKLLPLSGRYLPKKGDVIIGMVSDVNFSGWNVGTNSAYSAMLSMKDGSSDFIPRGADLTKYFNIGDYIVTKIFNVTSQNLIDLTMKGPGLKKINGGRILTVDPNKVPRIIGKMGSMVTMIKQETNCNIIVGQNGIIWIKGEAKDELLAVRSINKIVAESHISGLTEKMKEFINSEKK
ncbi:MAG: exosome complex protein Rrp4 [Nanoarchaeota archaeon]|nr:exosome complex protein Rrp4 [Nanoarchaeota archaeon]